MRVTLSDRTLILLLLAMNALLKFSWLSVNDLSGDEPFTVYWSRQPIAALFEMLRTENNPPLHFLLVKMWGLFTPMEENWLRVPSASFSILTIWPLFLLARKISDRWAALVACLLFTLNNHQYIYSHEVRGYSLLLLLSVLALWLLVRDASARPRQWILLSLVFVGLVYTHFFGWLVIGLLGICVFVLRELRPAKSTWIIAAILALVSYLPYGIVFFHRASESIVAGTWVRSHHAEEIWHMVRRWSNQPVVTLILLFTVVFVVVKDRVRHIAMRFGLLWMLVPLVGLWLLQWKVPVYVDRYLLFASPGFYLLAGHALVHAITTARWRWVLPATGVVSMAFTFTPWKDNGQHPSQAAKQVLAWQRSNTDPRVLVFPPWYKLTMQWHLDKSSFLNPPWSDYFSPAMNDKQGLGSNPGASGLIVVRQGGAEIELEAGGLPQGPPFVLADSTNTDDRVRVYRFTQ
ncbi:MAG: glycosyltransferase family 39 protein [Flavobacteriales bacterium]|nr:glycosyltransferase family 39 protein [Flavobacteriales bacterium]